MFALGGGARLKKLKTFFNLLFLGRDKMKDSSFWREKKFDSQDRCDLCEHAQKQKKNAIKRNEKRKKKGPFLKSRINDWGTELDTCLRHLHIVEVCNISNYMHTKRERKESIPKQRWWEENRLTTTATKQSGIFKSRAIAKERKLKEINTNQPANPVTSIGCSLWGAHK